MRRYIFLFIILTILVVACSSQEIQVTKTSTPPNLPTLSLTSKPTIASTLTPSPLPSPFITPTLSFELPPDCQKPDPTIDSDIYGVYDFKSIPCEYLSISPDGSAIVFVTLARVPIDKDSNRIARVAKLFFTSSSEMIQIYESKCVFLYPEWTPTGHLVISDVPYDVGCEYTAIYDTVKKEFITILDGIVHRNYMSYWSPDQNALFLLSPNTFGPTCNEKISGFDFRSESKFPVIKPITPDTNLYVVVGKPIWMSDNKTLLATLRDGVCSTENNLDCQYKNSYIVSFNLSGSVPKISHPFYDPTIDYSFHQTEQGIIEFNAKPSETLSCWEISE